MDKSFARLVSIMRRLRSSKGCPWDREQTHETILRCLIEEAYEFYEAVLEKDDAKMCEELGDLLLQIVFHAQMAAERRAFNAADVCRAISDKLERRHPHVFGRTRVKNSDEVVSNWEKIKRTEKSNRARTSILDGIPKAFPALLKAYKIQKRAARGGFDWKRITPVIGKIEEEIREVRAEINSRAKDRRRKITLEIGDLFFAVVNLSRHLHVDPEEALSLANRKFEIRFRNVEQRLLAEGKKMRRLSLRELDRYWDAEKLKNKN
ncbi:MAG: nucleoside triphosphate pyrophosphohydrolase [Elusimicrobia bacterium RIFOXYB2_FULL_49_7]|nr:MAG: nucleoside triphosphate pyrophosphohydrolase [Elusimicrobia bacterium RIFOXYB2_FULL_49_7]